MEGEEGKGLVTELVKLKKRRLVPSINIILIPQ